MPVPNLVCEVSYASGFASYMDDDVPWDTRRIVRKARPNSIALEKGNLGARMRASPILGISLENICSAWTNAYMVYLTRASQARLLHP
jgi:hypothetical protein